MKTWNYKSGWLSAAGNKCVTAWDYCQTRETHAKYMRVEGSAVPDLNVEHNPVPDTIGEPTPVLDLIVKTQPCTRSLILVNTTLYQISNIGEHNPVPDL